MQFIQTKLNSFFRKSGGGDDDDSECPNDDCIYDHTSSAKKYKKPMFWTQVVLVKEPCPEPVPIFDIEKDLQKDRLNQAIRQSAVREPRPFLFEPDDFKANRSELTVARYQLSEAERLERAQEATAIMRAISERVHRLTEEKSGRQ